MPRRRHARAPDGRHGNRICTDSGTMSRARVFLFASLLAGWSCGGAARRAPHVPPLIQPGAPGQPGRTIGVREATDLPRITFTDADVHFMEGMIGHHAQAIEMVDLLK